jgi:hypothetical protein
MLKITQICAVRLGLHISIIMQGHKVKHHEKLRIIKGSKANYLFLSLVRRACNILFAFSNSRLREADKPFPARFMKYCIIRIPEPNPLGLTFFEAICRAIVSASLVNIPFLGKVDSVVTFLTHRFLLLRGFLDGI